MNLRKTASLLCALVMAAGAAGSVYSVRTYAEEVVSADSEEIDSGNPDNENDEEEGGDFVGDETKAQSGTCGANLKWSLGTEGTLVIKGSGDMQNFTDKTPWNEYSSSVKKLIIESGVTSIATSAFDGCENLESVTIPATVKSIGGFAFEGTKWLENMQAANKLVTVNGILISGTKCTGSVQIPAGVKTIAAGAFAFNADITSVTIPDSVTSIEDGAFQSTGITSVTIGNGVTVIGSAAFSECAALTEVTLGSSVRSIGSHAFFQTGLTWVNVPQSVKSIGEKAFGYYYYSGAEDYDGEERKIGGFRITGYSSSISDKYANTNGFDFVSVGVVTIVYGDVTGEGSIGSSDLSLMQQYCAGWNIVGFDEIAGDVTGDGKVNNTDVARMQQYLAGWNVKLGV